MLNFQVSGKSWKAAALRTSATGNPILNTSWEQKMKAKAEAALFKAQKDEARAEKRAQLTVTSPIQLQNMLILGSKVSAFPARIISSSHGQAS